MTLWLMKCVFITEVYAGHWCCSEGHHADIAVVLVCSEHLGTFSVAIVKP